MLKNWRILTKMRLDVRYATALVGALMVLNQREVARWQTVLTQDIPHRPA
jgi:hypothetical protein